MMSIRSKLFIMLLLVSMIPFVLVGLIELENSENALKERIGVSSLEYAQLLADRINEYLYHRYQDTKNWANADIILEVLTFDVNGSLSRYLSEIKEDYKDYHYIICLNDKGRIIASSEQGIIGTHLSSEKGFWEAMNGKPYIQDVEYNRVALDYAIVFYVPVKSGSGKVVGILSSALKWSKVNEMVYRLQIRGKKQDISNHIMVTNKGGLIISCFHPDEMFRDNLIELGMSSARYAQEGKQGYLIETSEHKLSTFSAYTYFKKYKDLPHLGWLLVLLQDPKTIFSSVEVLKRIIILTIIATGVFLFLASLIIANGIAQPILAVASAAQAIGQGEYGRRVAITSRDEIGLLATSFNKMVEDLQKSQGDLLAAKNYTDNIIEKMTDSLIAASPDGQITRVNQATLDLLGYREEELIGRDVRFLFQGEDGILLEGYEIERLAREGRLTNHETHYRARDGRKIPVLLSGSGIIDEQDQVNGLVYVVRDITERKRAEQTLAAEKERLAVTLRSIGDGVIATNTEGRILLMNEVSEELTGWTQDRAIGKPLAEVLYVVDEKTCRRCEDPIEKVVETGKAVSLVGHGVLIARDGTRRKIAQTCAPIRDKDHQVVGVVLALRDVTEKQKMEEEIIKAQRLESIGILAGGIAHDFNNILTGIIGNISFAKSLIDHENEISDALRDAEKASWQAKDLTLQLLTFSKGGLPVKKTTSMTSLIKDTATFALRGSNVQCKLSLAKDLWPVDVDEGQIGQVISNLVINANQAMPEGGLIEIHAENKVIGQEHLLPLKDGRYIKISFKDRGVGILKEHLQKIFDPYFTTKQKGSGLGLAISYSIIQKHDGYITVESDVGVGTTFDIYLPASANQVLIEDSAREALVLGKGKVLFMDDQEITRILMERVLRRFGYEVMLAQDGAEAVDLYRSARESEQPFDVVVMDLTIPGGMGGAEVIKRLREIDPEVKAIVSSGYSNDPIMADYQKYGFKGSIAKPYGIERLNRVLHEVIGG